MKNLFLTLAFVFASSLSFANIDSNVAIEEEVLAMECFDFNDSCGGSWEVCHEGVSTAQLAAFLWEWDGGC
ncbi:MAG: hypothetical protein IBX66_00505 [Lutibacter sp.]|nr:hypothetical protein [Lutibacter sp.]